MKLRYILLTATLLTFSCTKEMVTPVKEPLTKMNIAVGCAQKTVLGANGRSINWQSQDKISLFDSEGNRQFVCLSDGAAATFSGSATQTSSYLLLYPYSSTAVRSASSVETVIPVSQVAVPGSFAAGAAVSAGLLEDGNQFATMKNVCSFVAFSLNAGTADVRNIKFQSNDSSPLTGPVSISVGSGNPSAAMQSGAVNYVELTSPAAMPSATYYMAVCPSTLSKGFKLTLTFANSSTVVRTFSDAITLTRGEVSNFGVIKADAASFVEETDDSASTPASSYASYGVVFSKLSAAGHPRLFLNQDGFNSIRTKIANCANTGDIYYQIHNALIKNADEYAASSETASYALSSGSMLDQSRNALKRMFHCAYAYRTTDEEKYLLKARTELAAVCAFKDWNASGSFLDASEMALAVAVVYDWLYYDLSLPERQAAHKALKDFDLTPFQTYATTLLSNWNPVCNGGALAAAIVLYEKDKALCANTINKAIASNLSAVPNIFGESGSYIEGPNYWQYATKYEAVIISALEAAFGTSCGLDAMPGIRNSGQWMLYMDGPTGRFNFSDVSDPTHVKLPELVWLAARFNQSELLVRERRSIKSTGYSDDRCLPLMMCAIEKYGFTYSPSSYPSSKIWTSGGDSPVVLARLGWNYDESDTFVGMKASGARNNHSHMDAGSFVYDAYGQRWACDIPMGSYSKYEAAVSGFWAMDQTSWRWDILGMNNWFHSTLSFTSSNGSVTKLHASDQLAGKSGSLVESYNSASAGYGAKMNLTPFYSDAASSVNRSVKLKDGNLYVIDEITSLSGSEAPFQWRMVTDAAVTVNSGYVTLSKGGKTVYLRTEASGSVSSSPAFAVETSIARPSSWAARSWDNITNYGDYKIVKFSASVLSGSKTARFTTVISETKPE